MLTATGQSARPRPSRHDWIFLVAGALVLLYCGWILSLPLFPSEDGPVHVYYATVSRSLMAGEATFSHSFRIAHRLPPYSLHAYVLVGLMSLMSGVAAEKALVCLALFSVAIGFAYFARQIGGSAGAMTLLALPFFAHRYLFIGFYGFSIGLGIALLAMGVWTKKHSGKLTWRLAFIGLALITSFTHPVPYALLLAYCGTELVIGCVTSPAVAPEFRKTTLSDLFTLAAAASGLLYVAAYAHSGPLWTFYSASESASNLIRIVQLIRLGSVLPLSGEAYQVILRIVFMAALVAAVYTGLRDWKSRQLTRSHLVLGWALLVIVLLPFAPDQLNGSYVFADRLSVWSVLLIMAAASRIELTARARMAIVAATVAIAVTVLIFLNSHMRPVARRLDVSGLVALGAPGAETRLLNRSLPPPDLTYDPYAWAGVRIIDRQRGVLLAAPWLNLSIMMLQATPYQQAEDALVRHDAVITHRLERGGIVVVADCGVREPQPESWSNTYRDWKQKYYPEWKTTRYSCFDVLHP